MQAIKQIGVLGAGQMGGGIAQVAAAAGIQVCLADMDLATAEKGKSVIAARLQKQVARGRLDSNDCDQLLARIVAVEGIAGFADVDMAIEAASENLSLKLKLFQEMDRVCKPSAVLASNTSSISITLMAAATERPAKVIGMHFFNPVPAMKLVEVIRGLATDDSTYNLTKDLAETMAKEVVTCEDKAGFVVNRLLLPFLNEACFTLEEGVASVEDIDKAVNLGLNHPMGPFALADFIGLDTCLAIMEVLHKEMGDSKYRPSPLLRKYVAAGWLGKKSGRGFYHYDG